MPVEIATLGSALGALALVLILVVLAGQAAKRLRLAPAGAGAKRLALVDSLALDARRRALLLRCDDRLFLVIAGGAGDAIQPLDKATP